MTANPCAPRIGLTGGIGSGKSTVAAMLAELGATLIDTDAIARHLTLPGGQAIEALRIQFGDTFIDASGALDRARMRELVFSDPSAKSRLQDILHPMIGVESERQALAAPGQAVVFDVPLLVESRRWRRLVDRVLVIDCHEDTQIQRVISRSGWTPDTVMSIMRQQAGRPTRRAAADAVIWNDGLGLPALGDQVRSIWHQWVAVKHPRRPSGVPTL